MTQYRVQDYMPGSTLANSTCVVLDMDRLDISDSGQTIGIVIEHQRPVCEAIALLLNLGFLAHDTETGELSADGEAWDWPMQEVKT